MEVKIILIMDTVHDFLLFGALRCFNIPNPAWFQDIYSSSYTVTVVQSRDWSNKNVTFNTVHVYVEIYIE